jgi:hypothetical protein
LKAGQSWPKITKIPKNIELSAMRKRAELLQKGGLSDTFFSSTLTPGKKMKEVIVYEYVSDKNLFLFLQIHLQITETAPAKSGLKQKEPKIQKMRLKDSFDSPRWWNL